MTLPLKLFALFVGLSAAAALVGATREVIVAADGSAPFVSIQTAIDSVKDATRENPVDVVVKPGRYHEMFTTKDWVNVSGTDRDTCIVVYNRKPEEPNHKTHVVWATSNSMLRNLTLIGRDVKYCIHSDGGRDFVLTIENCVLRREYPENYTKIRAAFGIGLRGKQHIAMRNCRFESDLSIFFHNWTKQKAACSFTVENTLLTGTDDAIRINNLGSGQRDFFVLHDNTLQSGKEFIRYANIERKQPPLWKGASEIQLFASGNKPAAFSAAAKISDDSKERRSGLDRANEANAAATGAGDAAPASGLSAVSRDGQVWVTWREAETSAGTTFNVYVSAQPIRDVATARRIGHHIERKSATDWWEDPASFTKGATPNRTLGFRLHDEGPRLDSNGGLFVHTPAANERGPLYFAVTHSDGSGLEQRTLTAGANSMTNGVSVTAGRARAIWQLDAAAPPVGAGKGKGIWLSLHGKSGVIKDSEYLAFGDASLGWREGLPFKFSVRVQGDEVVIRPTDRAWINRPFQEASDSGAPAIWTFWYGYSSKIHEGKSISEGTPTNYTERRLLWILDWVNQHYGTDRNRWYCSGSSMGGCGTMSFGWRHPELFAAVHAHVPIVSYTYAGTASAQRLEPLVGMKPIPATLRTDENAPLLERMDSLKYLQKTKADLPYLFIVNGRKDGSIPWQNNPPFYHALEASGQGHVVYWDDETHGASGKKAPTDVLAWTERLRRFRLDESFPAFSRTSTNRNPGQGDPSDGDLVGWMNRGMDWRDIEDTPNRYAITLVAAYEGVTYPVTTDMTLRRVQRFRPPAGTRLRVDLGGGRAAATTVAADGRISLPGVTVKDRHGVRVSFQISPAAR